MDLYKALYIDPGTGYMLFAILIGLIGVARFVFKGLWVKLRFFFSGGKQKDTSGKTVPLVVFSDDKRYWQVFEPVLRELDSRGLECVYMTMSDDDPGLRQTGMKHVKAEYIGPGNKAFARLNFLNARIVLSTTPGLDVYQWKRSKTVDYYIHIPHSPAEMTTYRMFGIDYYDALLLSGQFQIEDTRDLEKIRNLPAKDLVLTGSPFMDEKRKKFNERAGTSDSRSKDQRTVLLAPSWGKSSILNRSVGIEILSRYGNRFLRH